MKKLILIITILFTGCKKEQEEIKCESIYHGWIKINDSKQDISSYGYSLEVNSTFLMCDINSTSFSIMPFNDVGKYDESTGGYISTLGFSGKQKCEIEIIEFENNLISGKLSGIIYNTEQTDSVFIESEFNKIKKY
jgi:hypothetical protein